MIAQRVKKVIGIDHQQFPLSMAHLILDNLGIRNVTFEKKDAVCLDYEKGSFDQVVCFDAIEHIPLDKVEQVVKTIVKVLKKDGWLCLTTPNREELRGRFFGHKIIEKHYYEYSVGELKRIFSPYFKNMQINGVYLPFPIPDIEHFANVFPFRSLFKGCRLGFT